MDPDGGGTANLPTVSQTAGPYLHIGLAWLFGDRVADADVPGRHIVVEGRVLDGTGAPVSDALIEVWQADASGQYRASTDVRTGTARSGFRGFARVPTLGDGSFRLATVKPGRVPAPGGGLQAPHILVALFMRGLLKQVVTRIYFSDEPSNEEDLVLGHVPAPRRSTLIARPKPDKPDVFEWNVFLQGPHETVFFDA
jgi:protocatechuate 3,4-dioxygenase alpha subunit